jgi:Tfp pilus assembly protein PilV
MPQTKIQRRVGGYTLIEAMIASMILIFVLASVLALAGRGFRYLTDLRRWARSSQVLQQKMEDIRLMTIWTNVWALDGTSFTNLDIVGVPYGGNIDVSPYNPPYPTNIAAQVMITVTWSNTTGGVVSNKLCSIFCANGLNKYIF